MTLRPQSQKIDPLILNTVITKIIKNYPRDKGRVFSAFFLSLSVVLRQLIYIKYDNVTI